MKKAKTAYVAIQNDNESYEQEIQRLHGIVDTLEKQGQQWQNSNERMKSEVEALTSQLSHVARMQENLSEANARISSLQAQEERLGKELTALKFDKQTREKKEGAVEQATKMEMLKQLREKEREAESARSKLAEFQNEYSVAQERVNTLELENERLRDSVVRQQSAPIENQFTHKPAAQAQQLSFSKPSFVPPQTTTVEPAFPVPSIKLAPKTFTRPPLAVNNQAPLTTPLPPPAKPKASSFDLNTPIQPVLSLDCPTPTTKMSEKWQNASIMSSQDEGEENPNGCAAQ